MRSAGGFTLVELLIALLITLVVTAALLALVDPARSRFQAQPEAADVHQRLRVAVDALARDLLAAGAGLAPGAAPAIVPYRVGPLAGDIDAGVAYRPGTISATSVAAPEAAPVSRTYYLRADPATGASQLMRYDGLETDLPLVDHVAALDFAFFADDGLEIDPAAFQDGPWNDSEPDIGMFDADLLRIRRVRVVMRVEASRAAARGAVPDHVVQFDIAIRNAGR